MVVRNLEDGQVGMFAGLDGAGQATYPYDVRSVHCHHLQQVLGLEAWFHGLQGAGLLEQVQAGVARQRVGPESQHDSCVPHAPCGRSAVLQVDVGARAEDHPTSPSCECGQLRGQDLGAVYEDRIVQHPEPVQVGDGSRSRRLEPVSQPRCKIRQWARAAAEQVHLGIRFCRMYGESGALCFGDPVSSTQEVRA